jgi:hypothetical protein
MEVEKGWRYSCQLKLRIGSSVELLSSAREAEKRWLYKGSCDKRT